MSVHPATRLAEFPVVPLAEGGRRVYVPGHFGELLQGQIDGQVTLITLPCPDLGVMVSRYPGGFDVAPNHVLTRSRARAFLGATDGCYDITASAPLGGGAGVSTAALVGLACAAGHTGDLIAACLRAEGASDPLMFAAPERVLWASRAGRVVASLQPLPAFDVIGGFLGAPQRTDPQDVAFPEVSDLARAWNGVSDCADVARLSTQSAHRCLSLRGPRGDPTENLADELGALGIVIAHTGSARGLIFAPGAVPDHAEDTLRQAGFAHVLRFCAGGGA